MHLASQYEHFAEQCLEIAGRADPMDRETLQYMAAKWLSLAAEKLIEAKHGTGRAAKAG